MASATGLSALVASAVAPANDAARAAAPSEDPN
jgi:hypothetical protein